VRVYVLTVSQVILLPNKKPLGFLIFLYNSFQWLKIEILSSPGFYNVYTVTQDFQKTKNTHIVFEEPLCN